MGQMTLCFNKSGRMRSQEAVHREEYNKKEIERMKEEFSIEYCFKQIKEEMYLWDMRTWRKKDKEEVENWVNSMKINGNLVDDSKNCGHTALCIKVLKLHGVETEKIVNAILENDIIQYPKCKGCWYDRHKCPHCS